MNGIIGLCSVYFFFDFVNNPGRVTKDVPLRLLVAVFIVVYVEVGSQMFRLGRIFVDFFFQYIENVLIVNIDLKFILWRRLVVD